MIAPAPSRTGRSDDALEDGFGSSGFVLTRERYHHVHTNADARRVLADLPLRPAVAANATASRGQLRL
jgi:hypothetical protein